jgi:predicted nicotinamide N-methyase
MTLASAAEVSIDLPPALKQALPLETFALALGGRTWHITAVQNQDALLDVADQLEHIPYGFLLWESAIGLANLLVRQADQVSGQQVLELGAGVGLPGLVARALQAEVWQTDHEAHALALAATNATQNGVLGIHQFVADWRNWNHTPRYDLLLGADILYERAMHPYLEPIFRQNLAPGGRLLLADPCRPQAFAFVAELERRGWHFTIEIEKITLPIRQEKSKPVEVMLVSGTQPPLL